MARSDEPVASLLIVRLPGPLLNAVAGSVTKSNDLQASNVPGIREDVYVAGAKVLRSYPFGPLPGCAVMVEMVTHGETCCIGVNLDPAAITDVPLFNDCLLARRARAESRVSRY